MLKKVVLPAPLGPIRLTMLPVGTLKSTSLQATRPPNSLRTLRAISRSPFSLMGHHRLTDGHPLLGRSELDSPPAAGDQPLRAQQHHRHDHASEDAEGVDRDVDVGG